MFVIKSYDLNTSRISCTDNYHRYPSLRVKSQVSFYFSWIKLKFSLWLLDDSQFIPTLVAPNSYKWLEIVLVTVRLNKYHRISGFNPSAHLR